MAVLCCVVAAASAILWLWRGLPAPPPAAAVAAAGLSRASLRTLTWAVAAFSTLVGTIAGSLATDVHPLLVAAAVGGWAPHAAAAGFGRSIRAQYKAAGATAGEYMPDVALDLAAGDTLPSAVRTALLRTSEAELEPLRARIVNAMTSGEEVLDTIVDHLEGSPAHGPLLSLLTAARSGTASGTHLVMEAERSINIEQDRVRTRIGRHRRRTANFGAFIVMGIVILLALGLRTTIAI